MGLPGHLTVGTVVYSMYDNMRGKIIEIISTAGLQDEYRVKWRDGLVSRVYREEVY